MTIGALDDRIRNTDESRLPSRDEDGRVSPADCRVLEASIMLPSGMSSDEVEALMKRLYDHEPTVLHWSTNWRR